MSFAPRTRAFAALQKLFATPISEAPDVTVVRREREAVRSSRVGRYLFGVPDRRALVEDVDVALDGRTLRALVYRPTGVGPRRPVVVAWHPGGWTLGRPEDSAWLHSRIAATTGAVVVAPSYRLAPEHPFPAAVADAWETMLWLVAHADRLDVDTRRLAVMGESAGANLAAVVSLMARDALQQGQRRRDIPRIRLQVLAYPSVDMYERFSSQLRMPQEPVLTAESIDTFAHLYLGDAYGTDDWRASPLRAPSHADLPPAVIATAERDPLLDHGGHYRDALQAAGVRVDYREYPGAVHGFLSLPGVAPIARTAAADIADAVARAIVLPA